MSLRIMQRSLHVGMPLQQIHLYLTAPVSKSINNYGNLHKIQVTLPKYMFRMLGYSLKILRVRSQPIAQIDLWSRF